MRRVIDKVCKVFALGHTTEDSEYGPAGTRFGHFVTDIGRLQLVQRKATAMLEREIGNGEEYPEVTEDLRYILEVCNRGIPIEPDFSDVKLGEPHRNKVPR